MGLWLLPLDKPSNLWPHYDFMSYFHVIQFIAITRCFETVRTGIWVLFIWKSHLSQKHQLTWHVDMIIPFIVIALSNINICAYILTHDTTKPQMWNSMDILSAYHVFLGRSRALRTKRDNAIRLLRPLSKGGPWKQISHSRIRLAPQSSSSGANNSQSLIKAGVKLAA